MDVGLVPSRDVNACNRSINDLDPTRWCLLLSGTAGLRTLLQHPLVMAMTRKQSMREETTSRSVLTTMWRENGLRGMFRGFPSMACGMILSEVYFMFTFEHMRHQLGEGWLADGVSGFLSDFSAAFIQIPFIVIANRQMTAGCGLGQHQDYGSMWYNAKRIHSEHGIKGFSRGLTGSLLLSPHSGFWFALYGMVKERMYKASGPIWEYAQTHYGDRLHHLLVSKEDNIIVNSVAGFCSSVVVMTAYNPVIVVRTRVTILSEEVLRAGGRSIYGNVVRDLWRHEGIRGFFKGTVLNVSTSSFDGLLFALMYELTKQYAQK